MRSKRCSRGSSEAQWCTNLTAFFLMNEAAKKIIVIAGPTASGKSSLSVELAHRFGGEIVNADSMQVYREMNIGTAKPSFEVRANIPHHVFDVVDPDEDFNAAIYRSLAMSAIEDILARGRVCFLVGGTGLYIKSLLGGLFPCASADLQIREDLRRQCDELGSEALHKRLAQLDPESARKIHPQDRVRVTRSLEVIRITGRPFSVLAREHGFKNKTFNSLRFCLQIERKGLYHRINQRSLSMVEKGLVEETVGLLNKGYSPELKSMKALGYRHAVLHLKGFLDCNQMIGELQKDTRRYAKRQLTWFRADPEIKWVAPETKEFLIQEINAFIGKED
jgi:tRNA dimethylallyltransferase